MLKIVKGITRKNSSKREYSGFQMVNSPASSTKLRAQESKHLTVMQLTSTARFSSLHSSLTTTLNCTTELCTKLIHVSVKRRSLFTMILLKTCVPKKIYFFWKACTFCWPYTETIFFFILWKVSLCFVSWMRVYFHGGYIEQNKQMLI